MAFVSKSQQTLWCGEIGEMHIGGPMVIKGYLTSGCDLFYGDEEGSVWFVIGN